jgi:hypothetical protein
MYVCVCVCGHVGVLFGEYVASSLTCRTWTMMPLVSPLYRDGMAGPMSSIVLNITWPWYKKSSGSGLEN